MYSQKLTRIERYHRPDLILYVLMGHQPSKNTKLGIYEIINRDHVVSFYFGFA